MKKIFLALVFAGFTYGAECGNGDECLIKAMELSESNEALSDKYITKACEQKNLDACAMLIVDDTAPKEKREKLYNILKDGCLGSAPNMMFGCFMAATYAMELNDDETFVKLFAKSCQTPMTEMQKKIMIKADFMKDFEETCVGYK